ncbi:hypothetical protein NADFUDRAFT_5169, partial [Nadsonia fulvescens var. elongata DSM 6958]
ATLPIILHPSQLRPVAYRILSKRHGLNLKSCGLEYLAEFIGKRFGIEWRGAAAEAFLDNVARTWKDQDRGLFMDGPNLRLLVNDIMQQEAKLQKQERETASFSNEDLEFTPETISAAINVNWRDFFKVSGAFEAPALAYNNHRRQVEIRPPVVTANTRFGIPSSTHLKHMFTARYNLVYDRLLRHDVFQSSLFHQAVVSDESSLATSVNVTTNGSHIITAIKNLLGRHGKPFLLFGLLTLGLNGNVWLQDPSGKIELDITSQVVETTTGAYFTAGCLILCEGTYISRPGLDNDLFRVTSIGQPPSEARERGREAYGYLDFYGLHSTPETISGSTSAMTAASNLTLPSTLTRIDKKLERDLVNHEERLIDHKIVFLGGDLFLDQLSFLDAFKKFLQFMRSEFQESASQCAPIAFVIHGSFVSVPVQSNGASTIYKQGFDGLASLLSSFPELTTSSKFVFVPGDNDPWRATLFGGVAGTTYPLKPIPSMFTSRLNRVLTDVVWTSNPTRMLYLSQEIVIFRDQVDERLRRNNINFSPSVSSNIEDDNNDDIRSAEVASKSVFSEENSKSPSEILSPYVQLARKVARTLLDQSHLLPYTLSTKSVSWDHDAALWMTPLPNLLVMADTSAPVSRVTYEGCKVVNCGKFLSRGLGGSRVNWVEYTPSDGKTRERFLLV